MQQDTREHYLEAMNRAMEFIEAHAHQSISLEAIADYALLSKYHFHRIFKSMLGDTAKEYLTRLRLEKAALLLKHSQDTVSEIAYACGYSSPETFNRAFKTYFATTPTRYREQAQAEIAIKQARYAHTSLEDLALSPPKIITRPDINLAYIRHFGSFDAVGPSYRRLMLWATRNSVLKLAPTTVGILHDNPDLTAEPNIRFDACLLVTKEVQPQGEVGYKRIRGGKFAVFRYRGPYESFYPVYDYIYHVCLFEHRWELRDEPALEWYVKSPPFYKPEHYVTDFYLPIV